MCSSSTIIIPSFLNGKSKADLAPTKIFILSLIKPFQIILFCFGVILEWEDWESLCARLKRIDIDFLLKPKIRFKNENGEQGTLFLKDPSGNVLEFKSFKDDSNVFKK